MKTTTTTERVTKELLGSNKLALKFVHDFFNMDFHGEYKAMKVTERFTVNTLLKSFKIDPLEQGAYRIVIVMKLEHSYAEYFMSINTDGNLDIGTPNCGKPYRKHPMEYNMDSFSTKAIAEKIRKGGAFTAYALCQKIDDLDTSCKELIINSYTRYEVVNTKKISSFICSIKIKSDTCKDTRLFRNPRHSISDVSEVIDKSGYIVKFAHANYNNRVLKLKAEKEERELQNYNFTERANEMRKEYEAAKIRASQILLGDLSINSYTALCDAFYKLLNAYKIVIKFVKVANGSEEIMTMDYLRSMNRKFIDHIQEAHDCLDDISNEDV